jgi:hypothetical protein
VHPNATISQGGNDSDCHYFTCVDFEEEEMPWEEDWKTHKSSGLKPASRKWLQVVGLADEDEGV